MKYFMIILWMCISIPSLFSQNQIVSNEWGEQGIKIKEAHDVLLNREIPGKHTFSWSAREKKEGEKFSSVMIPWSIYQYDHGFSCYTEHSGRTLHVQTRMAKDKILSVSMTFGKIGSQEKILFIEFDCIVGHESVKSQIQLHRVQILNKEPENHRKEIENILSQHSSEIFQGITESQKNDREGIIHTIRCITAFLDIQMMETLSRDVVCKQGYWHIYAPSSSKYGNGRVLDYLLVFGAKPLWKEQEQSRSYVMNHRLVGGYLWLTAISGEWWGKYYIWQEQ